MPDVSPKTFAIISHAWNDDLIGGAFKVATDFARFLAGKGHEVHYLCGSDQGSQHAEKIDGVSVWRYRYPDSGGARGLLGHIGRMGELFRNVAQQHSFDAVSGHSPLQYYAVARQRRVCAAARYVYSVHSPFMDELQAAGRGSLPVRCIARWIDGRCLRYSDHVTTDSRYTMDRMRELYGGPAGKMSVQAIWVDTERFRPISNKNQVRTDLGAPWLVDVPTFVSVRRLEARMGLVQLVQAVAEVKSEGESLRLLIGGSGSMEAELRRQIESLKLQDTVFLLGRVPEDQLVETYAAADCFVLPTTALECFGMITLESYACGVPVIATPVAAIPEIVRQHDEAWLTSGTSASEIAVAIRKFLRSELDQDSAALRAIAERYGMELRATRLAETILGNEPTGNVAVSKHCGADG